MKSYGSVYNEVKGFYQEGYKFNKDRSTERSAMFMKSLDIKDPWLVVDMLYLPVDLKQAIFDCVADMEQTK